MRTQPQNIVVVIPTYNEFENIIQLLKEIRSLFIYRRKYRLQILVVDDHSPDGTANLVRRLSKIRKNIHLLEGEKKGIGAAYKRGFEYALKKLHADIVIQMDADFSHQPHHILDLLQAISNGADVAVGSRYIEGGTTPKDWAWHRKINSLCANTLARHVAGLSFAHDCTGGFKAIRSQLLRKIRLEHIPENGYSFQIRLLNELRIQKASIKEVPIEFVDRTHGESKMRLEDILEFLMAIIRIRIKNLYTNSREYIFPTINILLSIGIIIICYQLFTKTLSLFVFGITMFVILSLTIVLQSVFTFLSMLFAWDDPSQVEHNQSPKSFYKPKISFTAIVPALHEEAVIHDTIVAINAIDYPENLKQLIIICRYDDLKTIRVVHETIDEIGKNNIELIVPAFMPRNKPDKLNVALRHANHEVVCIFDAEDTPHTDIYNVANTVMLRDDADVVQSGVQLINFRSNWFSTLNVLEYFFWFKSVLHFFALRNVIPLGGNTVFFKREWLTRVNGWDADCLTEDADIGIKLSAAGAKIRIIYDEIHATREETPQTIGEFIKQRTRWNQGFLQVYKKGEWRKLPLFSQRFFVGYMLIWPEIQAILFAYIAASIIMMFTIKLPMVVTLLSLLPLYILILHFVMLNVGLHEFTKKYALRYPWWMPFKLLITFFPYQIMLGLSSLRAVWREFRNNRKWEKTTHVNAHRETTGEIQPVST